MQHHTPTLVDDLAWLSDSNGIIIEEGERSSFETDWRGIVSNPSEAVLLPSSTADVARIVKICARHGVSIVPQGGNTGLVAGGVPVGGRRQVILSLRRMNRIREIDVVNDTMIVEAGAVLSVVQDHAARADRLFPLSLGAEGSCQIGGNIATNAGGVQVLAYGSMRNMVLGLEVVLADGRVWNGLRAVRKDNTGIDLKQMFIGSEGTLGIITAATLRLVPSPKRQVTGLIGLASPEAALEVFTRMRDSAGSSLTSFEFFSEQSLGLVIHHVKSAVAPFAESHPGYVLFEISSLSALDDPTGDIETVLSEYFEADLIRDATIAASESQRRALWGLRDNITEGERAAGGALKHDIAVPISKIPMAIARLERAIADCAPGARLNIFGHIGDGNLHVNVMPAEGQLLSELGKNNPLITSVIEDTVVGLEGSFSAEHGIGQIRVGAMLRHKQDVEIDLMRIIKQALDNHGTFNPGKIIGYSTT